MHKADYLEHLAADTARLREAAAGTLTETVPTCAPWTGADLLLHVAEVYRHKATTMRHNAWPSPWPPDFTGADPVAAYDDAYAELRTELSTRDAEETTLTWYPPEQTVGFWARRMAHEALIHRVDAELTAGLPITPIPADLAADGVDEVLTCFLAFATAEYPQAFEGALDALDGRTVRVDAGDSSWFVTLAPTITVAAEGTADATVTGDPDQVLLWLWRRVEDPTLKFEGDPLLPATLHTLLKVATQ
ncbi:maleylpyruvate isomerase family mycothiol-dependent enzyme [Actinokineospora auranticolor]|uniref:Uncharacterized protein (TIGR03083 family) n=1 Tax=Actinokineospora auranticolor TaxID=155976 RepID=A0A2S6GR90_9PSEU|nr:maleylpyruvate isomerase family mycothiol-dependent enzyme [Actinokineospora auranticolor]PPK67775.1 uncharacterized protein (TIGR03083 family) [Actinokineospora auranticolor]